MHTTSQRLQGKLEIHSEVDGESNVLEGSTTGPEEIEVMPGFGNVKVPPINLLNRDTLTYLMLWHASCFDV